MKVFIGYTVGLNTRHPNLARPRLAKVEFNYVEDETVSLTLVSGGNLSRIRAVQEVVVSREEYLGRPFDACDNTVEARWALGRLGASI